MRVILHRIALPGHPLLAWQGMVFGVEPGGK